MGKELNEADPSTKEQRIYDDGDLRKYRIELPNLYDDADLDPYEFRLLAHYKRVGNCWEGTRTTAEKCKMSVGKVVEARDSLHEKGFIVIDEYLSEHATLQITVTDVWAENFAKYSKMKAAKQARSQGEQAVHTANSGCSHGEHKKEPLEEVRTYVPKTAESENPEIPEYSHPAIKQLETIITALGYEERKEVVALAQDSSPAVFQSAFAAFHAKVYEGKYSASWRSFKSFWTRENDTAKLRAKAPPPRAPTYRKPEPVSNLRVRTD